MRVEALTLTLGGLLLASRLAAWGGSPVTWMDGTQPWDTTPGQEVDAQLLGLGGNGHPRAGLDAQWGVFDLLQASAEWRQPFDGAPGSGEAGLKLREPYYPEHRPALALYARAPYDGAAWAGWGGLALATSPWDLGLAANAEAGGGGHWRLRLAGWSPYVVTTLRVGFEAAWLDAAPEAWTPQVLVNAPGDISLHLGLRLDAQGGAPQWTARLSYEIFPNP